MSAKNTRLKAIRRMVEQMVALHPEIPPEDMQAVKRNLYKKLRSISEKRK